MNIARRTSNMIKAEVDKLVASRDDVIKQLQDDSPEEFDMFKDITLNLKLRVYDKQGPLALTFYYPPNFHSKSVMLYISHTNKEPNKFSNI